MQANGPTEKARGRKVRNPERSQSAILDAAEIHFARQGFDGTSIAAIAKSAGVSVGLPGYFFGSKEQLYREVLRRVFDNRDIVLGRVTTAAEQILDSSNDGVSAIRHLVWGYTEFLLDNPTFVWLLTRDALEHANTREKSPRHSLMFAERMAKIMSRAGCVIAGDDPDNFFLSLIAMCYFPLEHDATVVAGMGQRAWSHAFQTRRVEHIVQLLLPHGRQEPTGATS